MPYGLLCQEVTANKLAATSLPEIILFHAWLYSILLYNVHVMVPTGYIILSSGLTGEEEGSRLESRLTLLSVKIGESNWSSFSNDERSACSERLRVTFSEVRCASLLVGTPAEVVRPIWKHTKSEEIIMSAQTTDELHTQWLCVLGAPQPVIWFRCLHIMEQVHHKLLTTMCEDKNFESYWRS